MAPFDLLIPVTVGPGSWHENQAIRELPISLFGGVFGGSAHVGALVLQCAS
jgi:hypothetical protein